MRRAPVARFRRRPRHGGRCLPRRSVGRLPVSRSRPAPQRPDLRALGPVLAGRRPYRRVQQSELRLVPGWRRLRAVVLAESARLSDLRAVPDGLGPRTEPRCRQQLQRRPGTGTKTQLSVDSPYCPWHSEATAAGNFNFPPREQPMHAVRRSLIAAMKIVSDQNAGINAAVADQVSIVTYDGIDGFHAPKIHQALTNNYTSAMTAATRLQAAGDIGATTATENGVIAGRAHIKKKSLGGAGREFTNKVMILITDGMPNVWQSGSSEINTYIASNPNANYYGTGYDWYNSVLMQAAQFKAEKGEVYPVGMGLGADFGFMDRIARISKTDEGPA